MNRDRIMFGAKKLANELSANYRPPSELTFAPGGEPARTVLHDQLQQMEQQGRLMPHDRVVGETLANVLVGGNAVPGESALSESELFALEREAFLKLVQTEATQARISHTLKTGRPLRN